MNLLCETIGHPIYKLEDKHLKERARNHPEFNVWMCPRCSRRTYRLIKTWDKGNRTNISNQELIDNELDD